MGRYDFSNTHSGSDAGKPGVDISRDGSGSEAGNPSCPKCGHNGQVHRDTDSYRPTLKWTMGMVKLPKVKADGWMCYNCSFAWDI